jgi:hypothetical protein
MHTRTYMLRITAEADDLSELPDPVDMADGIRSGLPDEWFEDGEGDEFALVAIEPVEKPTVFIEWDYPDSGGSARTFGDVDVVEFDLYMLHDRDETGYTAADLRHKADELEALLPDATMSQDVRAEHSIVTLLRQRADEYEVEERAEAERSQGNSPYSLLYMVVNGRREFITAIVGHIEPHVHEDAEIEHIWAEDYLDAVERGKG